jgi:hypothetical protein
LLAMTCMTFKTCHTCKPLLPDPPSDVNNIEDFWISYVKASYIFFGTELHR